MSCFHPIEAWQMGDGTLVFKEHELRGKQRKHGDQRRYLNLPCGRCIGCRIQRQRTWAIRCMHEARMHRQNCFATLTYNDEHYTPSLHYEHFQHFIRGLRLVLAPDKIRFFMAGEYGDETERPHYHALLFGHAPSDAHRIGKDLYASKTIDAIWGRGFTSIGNLTYASARYCASYTTKKITGKDAERHYQRVDPRTGEIIQLEPEFARMSLKPGIGRTWFDKYWRDVYDGKDGITEQGGRRSPPPRIYDTWLKEQNIERWEEIELERYKKQKDFLSETTEERLRVREKCAEAKMKFYRKEKI